MNRRIHYKLKNDGATLVLAICAVVLLLVIGAGMLSLGMQGQLTSIRTGSEIKARTAADAGLNQALYMMNRQIKSNVQVISHLPHSSQSCDGANVGLRTSGYQ